MISTYIVNIKTTLLYVIVYEYRPETSE